MTHYTDDELVAWSLDLTDAQAKMLKRFSDGRSHMYVHFGVGEALRKRGYLIRSSYQMVRSEWANHEGVRKREHGDNYWRHEWDTTGKGYHLARFLDGKPRG